MCDDDFDGVCDVCGDPDAPYVRADGREVCAEHRGTGDPIAFRRIRLTLGMTVEETADMCGVQARTVRRWESGRWVPPADAQAVMGRRWDQTAAEVAALLAGESAILVDGDAALRLAGLARMVTAVNAQR